ncbi:MAG TPA: hypothetical protein VEA59_06080, partial [Patescibacteria group bacterium]|nr:hypothetical protein [Patescibacteria group bacterium]
MQRVTANTGTLFNGPWPSAGIYTYSLKCEDPSGSITKTITINAFVKPAPALTNEISGGAATTELYAYVDQPVTMRWNAGPSASQCKVYNWRQGSSWPVIYDFGDPRVTLPTGSVPPSTSGWGLNGSSNNPGDYTFKIECKSKKTSDTQLYTATAIVHYMLRPNANLTVETSSNSATNELYAYVDQPVVMRWNAAPSAGPCKLYNWRQASSWPVIYDYGDSRLTLPSGSVSNSTQGWGLNGSSNNPGDYHFKIECKSKVTSDTQIYTSTAVVHYLLRPTTKLTVQTANDPATTELYAYVDQPVTMRWDASLSAKQCKVYNWRQTSSWPVIYDYGDPRVTLPTGSIG